MDGEPCRVLVVDDNRDAADAAVMLLEMWGHEAMTAYSAAECIAVAKMFNPDIVLMDIGLPDKDGFAVKRELEDHCPEVASSRSRALRRPTLSGNREMLDSRTT